MSATINHPNTKKTLHGEVYGFHLMSTNLDVDSQTSQPSAVLPTLPAELTRSRRQVESFDPATPESRTPFFRLRNFFKFIRRMISLVTVPVFRFARRLIQPWTRRLVPLRPTTPNSTPKPAAPPTSTIRTLVGSSTPPNVTNSNSTTPATSTSRPTLVNGTSGRTNLTEVKTTNQISGFTEERFNLFDESIIIYEPEYESLEHRPSRDVVHTSPRSVLDSIEVIEQNTEKCALIAAQMDSRLNSSENFVTPSSHKSADAITQLGPHLQFIQFLYSCCPLEGNDVLISWEETEVMLNNVITDTIEGCGNF